MVSASEINEIINSDLSKEEKDRKIRALCDANDCDGAPAPAPDPDPEPEATDPE
jgi:hypothetical protein